MTFFGKATEAQPGDLFCASMGGLPGIGVELGQVLDGDPARWVSWITKGRPEVAPGVWPQWMYEHAGIYIGDMTVVEAEPAGARRRVIPDFENAGARYVLWSTGCFPDLSPTGRQLVVDAALRASDPKRPGGPVGYSWEDYLWLSMHRFGLNALWLEAYIKSSGHMICSQLADWCYQQGGEHIFSDGRWYGDVTPSDMAGNFVARARKLHLI